MFEVREYTSEVRSQVEDFRQATFAEGNEALAESKFDPDNLNGQTFYVTGENEIAALGVIEQDHYATKDAKVFRACRFHALKQYRNQALGTRFILPAMIDWATDRDYDCVYWTHDVKQRALNAIYQKKRTPAGYTHLQDDPFWSRLKHDERWLFQVDPKSEMLQHVYYIDLNETNYKMNPIDCVIWK